MITHVSRNLYRSPRPSGVDEIISAEVSTVINLESGVYELLHEDAYEKEIRGAVVEGLLDYVEWNLGSIFPPKESEVRAIVTLICAFPRENFLVHCKAGKDRTGFIVAAYRMLIDEWSFEDAVKEMKEMGQHLRFRWWIPFLRKYEVKK